MSATWGPRAHPERCDENDLDVRGPEPTLFPAALWAMVLLVMLGVVAWAWRAGW